MFNKKEVFNYSFYFESFFQKKEKKPKSSSAFFPFLYFVFYFAV